MNENEISKVIVTAAIEVHRELGGPGLVEDVYEEALEEELRLRGVLVERPKTQSRGERLKTKTIAQSLEDAMAQE